MQMYLSKVKIREAMDSKESKPIQNLLSSLELPKINYLLCYPMITIL